MASELSAGTELTFSAVHLAGRPPNHSFNIKIKNNTVQSIDLHSSSSEPDSAHCLLLPSLCHPHIHLDKAFLLTSNSERYQDLMPTAGSFQEALKNTSEAKTRYDAADLELRGAQLIAESVEAGVTAMRAFVEIDHAVGFKCLEAAVVLKRRFEKQCLVQICVFAQDPICSGPYGDYNMALVEQVLHEHGPEIGALGTTPYVETTRDMALRNIGWAVDKALRHNIHLDFHLDYNLGVQNVANVWDVIRILREQKWTQRTDKTIALGHCSRLTLFSDDEMASLATEIKEAKLPISFIGLPTSDLYMMGRPPDDSTTSSQRPRGTLQIPMMIKPPYNLNCALSINNVGNAFTPWGSVDPLRLACLGVGIYQAGTKSDAELLYECVSTRARKAIGLEYSNSFTLREGDELGQGRWMLFETERAQIDMGTGGLVPRRMKSTVHEVVWDPPGLGKRTILRPQNDV